MKDGRTLVEHATEASLVHSYLLSGRERDRLMTQQQRGRLLVVMFVVVIVALQGTNWWANTTADDRAVDTAQRLRVALPTIDLVELRTGLDNHLSEMFPVRSVIEGGRGVRVNVEVSSVWHARCVVGHIGPDGVATTETFNKGCGG